MRAIFSFKNGVQLSIRPFNEWMILAKSASPKELEVMCHSVLLETGSLLEKVNIISQKEFRDLFANSRVYASDYIMLTLLAVDAQELYQKSTDFPLMNLNKLEFIYINVSASFILKALALKTIFIEAKTL